MTPGYLALRNSAAVLDLSARGRIRVVGEDRARLLHAMSTNHVQGLVDGSGLHAFFLSAQGRILADACILRFPDYFLLDTEPETRTTLFEHLDRFIIADDVELEDVTEQTFCLGVEGPQSLGIVPCPETPYAHTEWEGCTIAAIAATGPTGIRIHGPSRLRPTVLAFLEKAGVPVATARDAELARIHNFKPRYGSDFDGSTLTGETLQTRSMHYQKGCYIGQEIVERVRSRGHVNRTMMGFRLEGHSVPAPGSTLYSGGKETGEGTSAAEAPDGGYQRARGVGVG